MLYTCPDFHFISFELLFLIHGLVTVRLWLYSCIKIYCFRKETKKYSRYGRAPTWVSGKPDYSSLTMWLWVYILSVLSLTALLIYKELGRSLISLEPTWLHHLPFVSLVNSNYLFSTYCVPRTIPNTWYRLSHVIYVTVEWSRHSWPSFTEEGMTV